jgi:hypothetical protein
MDLVVSMIAGDSGKGERNTARALDMEQTSVVRSVRQIAGLDSL